MSDGPGELSPRTRHALLWSGLQSWGRRGLTTVVFVILARLLAPEDFGLVAIVAVFTMSMSFLQGLGIIQAIVQANKLDKIDQDSAFWASLGMSAFFVVLIVLLAPLIETLLRVEGLEPILRVCALAMPFSAMAAVPSGLLRRHLDLRPIAISALIATIISGILGVLMAVSGAGVWALVVQFVTLTIVENLLITYHSGYRPSLQFCWKSFAGLFAESRKYLGLESLHIVNRYSPDLVIGAALGPVVLGFFSVAQRLAMVSVELTIGVLSNVTQPLLADMRRRQQNLSSAYVRGFLLVSAIALPVFALLAVHAPSFILVLFGEGWDRAIPLMVALSVKSGFGVLVVFGTEAIIGAGHAKLALRLSMYFTVANLLVFVVGLPFGAQGIANAMAAKAFLSCLIVARFACQVTTASIVGLLRGLWPVSAALFALVSVGILIRSWSALSVLGSFPRLAIEIGASGAAYALIILVVGREIVSPIWLALRPRFNTT